MVRTVALASLLAAASAYALRPAPAAAGGLVLETSWGTHGSAPGQFDLPSAVDLGPDGSVYVVDRYNYRIQRFAQDGALIGLWGSFFYLGGIFLEPWGLAVSEAAEVFVTDWDLIHVFSESGDHLRDVHDSRFPPGAGRPFSGLTVLPDGSFLVCSLHFDEVVHLSPSGEYLVSFGESGIGPGQFDTPADVAIDTNGDIYVVDSTNHRVQVFNSAYQFLREWNVKVDPGPLLSYPTSIAISGTRIYVADISWILEFDLDGNLTGGFGTPGTETPGYSAFIGLAATSSGQVFATELEGRILRFGPAPVQTTTTTWGRLKALHR